MGALSFQAEDGIRDGRVTGVQTCALPIWAAQQLITCAHRRIGGRCGGCLSAAFWGAQARRYPENCPCAHPFSSDWSEIGRASCRERVLISVVVVSSTKKVYRSCASWQWLA